MSAARSSTRSRPDVCPGVLAVHQAADGGLVRVRIPGGLLTADQLRVLSAAAAEFGDGLLELTARANVQVRGLPPGAELPLSRRLAAAGLLPSSSHERVRNIVASPLSGLDGRSRYDVLRLVTTLDRALCETPVLAELPGRFLFALDDGRGDLATLMADAGVRAIDGDRAGLLLAGTDTGVQIAYTAVPATLVAAGRAFLAERAAQGSSAWRLAELTDGANRVLDRLGLPVADGHDGDAAGRSNGWCADDHRTRSAPAVGMHEQSDGRVALVAAVPLGRLTPAQSAALTDLAGLTGNCGQLRVTPWRSIAVPGLPAPHALPGAHGDPGAQGLAANSDVGNSLRAAGLVVDAGSAWIEMTGCAGRPGCAKANADVRADATRLLPLLPSGRAVHWSGCERRCGRPAESVDVVATGNGYLVDGAGTDDLVASIAARRTA